MKIIKLNINDSQLEMLRKAAEHYGISFREAYSRALDEHVNYPPLNI